MRSPKYLIMRPEFMEELKFEQAEEHGLSIEDVIGDIMDSYEGLIVAICTKRNFPDFELC